MHPSVLDNVIDILFCINVGFVVVSTLGKKKEKKTPTNDNDQLILVDWLIDWFVGGLSDLTGESINRLIVSFTLQQQRLGSWLSVAAVIIMEHF